MSLPAAYSSILSDLNRDVLRSQPADPLQFCANWFAARLESERGASRTAGAEKGTHRTSTPVSAGSRASHGGSERAKKASHSSTKVGQDYTFGGPRPMEVETTSASPFSNSSPFAQPSVSTESTGSSSAANVNASSLRDMSLVSPGRPSKAKASDEMQEDSDEDVYDPRDNPNYNAATGTTTSVSGESDSGIPEGYNLGRRTSVSAESLDPNSAAQLPKVVIPKTPSQRARIEASISKNLLFRNLDEDQHVDVLNAMKEVSVSKGTEVIVQGAVGDFFYVVEEGTFEVWVRAPPKHTYAGPGESITSPGEEKQVASYGPGGSFGELALMYNAPRAATVVATSPATMWALDRVTFRSILMEHTSRKRKMYESFLSEVPILASLNTKERAKIADALEEKMYDEGEEVVVEGEVGKNFYIIESGKAEVSRKKKTTEGAEGAVEYEVLGSLGKGDYFGGAIAFRSSFARRSLMAPRLLQSSPSSTRLLAQRLSAPLQAKVVSASRRLERRPLLACSVRLVPSPHSRFR